VGSNNVNIIKVGEVIKSAALASTISFGIMSLVEVSDGFADTVVGFSHEDMVANAAGAAFSYLGGSKKSGSKRFFKHFFDHIQVPKTSLEAVSF